MNYLAIILSIFFGSNTADSNDLTIQIENITTMKGVIEVGIFNNDADFLKEGKAFKTVRVNVTKNAQTIVIKDLPTGHYAISTYHDVNSDGKCNLNFIGIPKEPYAFSNNFRPKLSAPNFKDCEFMLNSNKSLKLQLKG